MNYPWEAALQAEKQGISRKKLKFMQAKNASPYMEIAFENLNDGVLEDITIPINYLFRFSDVFSHALDINVTEYRQLREVLMDVFMHYFVQIDLRQGLCKSEYYIRFLLKDILHGALGEENTDAIKQFTGLGIFRTTSCKTCLQAGWGED